MLFIKNLARSDKLDGKYKYKTKIKVKNLKKKDK